MKKIFYPLTVLLVTGAIFLSCEKAEPSKVVVNEEEKMVFDSLKAIQYGADVYGMKKYVMAFLKSGDNRGLDSLESVELQRQHLKNIQRMAEENKLVLAGPFLDGGELRGIYIFNVQTIEEAEELTNTDPSIQRGVLKMELIPWYGSAALMSINKEHKTLMKTNIAE